MSRSGWMIPGRLERQPGRPQKGQAEIGETEPITVARLMDCLVLRGLFRLWTGTAAQVFVTVCSQAML
ncbi:MAG: hypothetical protein ACRYHQ_10750 [Janthinobacterium lividum]